MVFKSVSEFHNRAIDKLVTQVEQQKDLLTVIKSVLPEELAKNTSYCVVHDSTLFIYTMAAVWSSQLRFYETAILDAISPLIGKTVKRVQIRLSR